MAHSSLTVNSRSRVRADLILLLASLFWGIGFSAQRVGVTHLNPNFFNGLRFLLAGLVLLPLVLLRWKRIQPMKKTAVWGSVVAGVVLFGAASLQSMGVRYTTAANAGFITGLYVVIIPIILSIVFKRSPRRSIWLAAAVATIGLFLLSTGGSIRLNNGDALVLFSALFWGLHVLVIGWLVKYADVFFLGVVQFFICGLLNLWVGWGPPDRGGMVEILGVWHAILYNGIFSVGLGFTLQALGQEVAPAADAAIILCMESVFSAIFGWILLGEYLLPVQILGCVLMLAGMMLAQIDLIIKNTRVAV
ncbi:MAG: DMT family transporter [Anaerolineales bacterium]|nr:DMT family transporter [Anaerolineales bacterium]